MEVLAVTSDATISVDPQERRGPSEPYLVISTDGHAGPVLERDLRPYCPSNYLDQFDDFAHEVRAAQSAPRDHPEVRRGGAHVAAALPDFVKEAYEMTRTAGGQQDPHARLGFMDADGIAADVIFAGGQNGEPLPFVGFGLAESTYKLELRSVGGHIWNQWLADYVSVAPQRLVGVMQIPIWDVKAAIQEIEWGRDAGLRSINFPAPRSGYPSYNDPVYEPFWSACESLELPLLTHTGGGDVPLGLGGPGGFALLRTEIMWLSRRSLWQLIFGGVFERHPRLKLVFTEQRVLWVPETLKTLDNIFASDTQFLAGADVTDIDLPRRPSEYWASNCYVAGSFLAPFEVALRNEVGVHNLMWGADYPHVEGTWPRTNLSMRNTFADVPEDEARLILGENALGVYDLDAESLRPIALRIGPMPDQLAKPLAAGEFPEFRGEAFRTFGDYT
jgi:predicted TIM-barrel fold metal-dependent hydrolase